MIIILGSPKFIRDKLLVLSCDWPDKICCFHSVHGAAGLCEGTRAPHVVIVDEVGLYLMNNSPLCAGKSDDVCYLEEAANICLVGDSFVYRPKGIREHHNTMEMDSLYEAIAHALEIGQEQVGTAAT